MTSSPRSAFALGLTLGLFVALAPSCGSGGSGGVGGGTGGSGVGGGSAAGGGSGTGGGTSVGTFCADFASAYCDYAVRCGYASPAARAECATYIGPLYCAGAASIAKGYQALDSSQASSCVIALADAGCESSVSPLTASCEKVVTAKSNTNEGCFANGDCKNANEGCGGPNCMQTCQLAGAQGKPCPKTGSCAAGLRCDYVTNTCVPPGGVGAACRYFSDCDSNSTYCDTANTSTCLALPTAGQTCRTSIPACTNGYYCNQTPKICEAKLATGATCTTTAACQDALFCDFTKTPDSCQPRLGVGGNCATTGFDSCQASLRCISGTCQTPKAAGVACVNYNDCTDGLYCDDVLKTCQASVYDLMEGQTCTGDTRNCDNGLFCKGWAINPTPGAMGTLGTCVVPKAGDPCKTKYASECPTAAFCNLAVDGGPGTCVTASLGSPCQGSASYCLQGHYCEGGLCAARKAAGATCTADNNCQAPLQCVTNPATAAKTCGTLPDVGQACAGSSSSGCLFPNQCVAGTCVHTGKVGEKCLGGGQCFSGKCDTDAGVCQSPGATGAACRANVECSSGRCFQGKCEAVCP